MTLEMNFSNDVNYVPRILTLVKSKGDDLDVISLCSPTAQDILQVSEA